ncbi:MAG TPA: hypothetical protein VD948_06875 [Rhodothermales bacterium]|nr:hypothetical protein [Rhodothermales bacterium]
MSNTLSPRAALLDALAYLRDEVEMVRVPLRRLPEALQTTRPYDDALSLRETYALLAARDEARLLALHRDEAPLDPTVPPGANDLDTETLLDHVVETRARLLAAVEALSDEAFARSASSLHAAVVEDAALLRTLAEHLYGAHGPAG